jgi:phenylacetic acid degradation operon negative regulatory protein
VQDEADDDRQGDAEQREAMPSGATVPVVSDTIGDGSTRVPTRLLVYSMVHPDGSVDAAELLPVAAACGLSADQVRSCLRRMVAEGLCTREGTGRDARYLPTDEGRRAVEGYLERTRLAYAQDLAGRGWDRHWHLVAFGIPEARRAGRDALRERLVALGGASIHNGLYVSPHPWDAEVRAVADAHGVLDAVTLVSTDELEVGGDADPRRLASRLWPLDDLARRYERFIEHHTFVAGFLEDLRT